MFDLIVTGVVSPEMFSFEVLEAGALLWSEERFK